MSQVKIKIKKCDNPGLWYKSGVGETVTAIILATKEARVIPDDVDRIDGSDECKCGDIQESDYEIVKEESQPIVMAYGIKQALIKAAFQSLVAVEPIQYRLKDIGVSEPGVPTKEAIRRICEAACDYADMMEIVQNERYNKK